jgi:hypothetical protein
MDEILEGTAELYRAGVNSHCTVHYSITYSTSIETKRQGHPLAARTKGIVNYIKPLEASLTLPDAIYSLLPDDEIIQLQLIGGRWFVR